MRLCRPAHTGASKSLRPLGLRRVIRVTCSRGVGATLVPRAPKQKRRALHAELLHVYDTSGRLLMSRPLKIAERRFGHGSVSQTFKSLTSHELGSKLRGSPPSGPCRERRSQMKPRLALVLGALLGTPAVSVAQNPPLPPPGQAQEALQHLD